MAIAIAMSSPITYCDFRDAETIMHDLRSLVYGSVRRDGKSNRLKQAFTIANLVHFIAYEYTSQELIVQREKRLLPLFTEAK